MKTKYIFHIVKGLESIAKQELEINDVLIESVNLKFIIGYYDDNITRLSKLFTIDDIGIVIEDMHKLTSDDILGMIEMALDSRLLESITQLKSVRGFKNYFSVTLNKYKIPSDITDAQLRLSEKIQKLTGYEYVHKDHSNIDIRIDADPERLIISLKLFTKSLFKRDYINEEYLGSLKPTIASSLIMIAVHKTREIKPKSVIDTFCGSGTILCEGFLQGYKVYGNDINPEACEVSCKRLSRIGSSNVDIRNESAEKTSWQDNTFDLAISNPPWNEKLKTKNMKELLKESIKEYSRILNGNGTLCLLTKYPEITKKYIQKYFKEHNIEKYPISFNGQNPTIVVAYKKYDVKN